MSCKMCERFWQRAWDVSDAWEREQSNESYLWQQESKENLALIDKAMAIQSADAAAALHLFRQAADAGSIWAMDMVGWHYRTGIGTEGDFAMAQDYYLRAISAGSWMATLGYAKLLDAHGYHEQCAGTLEDGIGLGFAPAAFWLARLRHDRSKTSQTCRVVRPLLDYAANRGHPVAQLTLARWKLIGKFGIAEVAHGLGSWLGCVCRFARDAEETSPRAKLMPAQQE